MGARMPGRLEKIERETEAQTQARRDAAREERYMRRTWPQVCRCRKPEGSHAMTAGELVALLLDDGKLPIEPPEKLIEFARLGRRAWGLERGGEDRGVFKVDVPFLRFLQGGGPDLDERPPQSGR